MCTVHKNRPEKKRAQNYINIIITANHNITAASTVNASSRPLIEEKEGEANRKRGREREMIYSQIVVTYILATQKLISIKTNWNEEENEFFFFVISLSRAFFL